MTPRKAAAITFDLCVACLLLAFFALILGVL